MCNIMPSEPAYYANEFEDHAHRGRGSQLVYTAPPNLQAVRITSLSAQAQHLALQRAPNYLACHQATLLNACPRFEI